MKTYELVCLGKTKQGIKSDREFALFNGFSVSNISDWKAERANASTANFLKLIEVAGLDLNDAIEIANSAEKRKNLRQAGFMDLELITCLAGVSLLAVHPTSQSLVVGGIAASTYAALYIMRSKHEMWWYVF